MDRNLFLAILSMDSYNRGYGQAIKENKLGGNQVGGATLGINSSVLGVNGQRPDITAGFYAQVYNWNGQKVIMYRGSDNIPRLNIFLNAVSGNNYRVPGTQY